MVLAAERVVAGATAARAIILRSIHTLRAQAVEAVHAATHSAREERLPAVRKSGSLAPQGVEARHTVHMREGAWEGIHSLVVLARHSKVQVLMLRQILAQVAVVVEVVLVLKMSLVVVVVRAGT